MGNCKWQPLLLIMRKIKLIRSGNCQAKFIEIYNNAMLKSKMKNETIWWKNALYLFIYLFRIKEDQASELVLENWTTWKTMHHVRNQRRSSHDGCPEGTLVQVAGFPASHRMTRELMRNVSSGMITSAVGKCSI